MIEKYFVGVYWGNRPETLAACADRSSALLTALSRIDPVMSNWVSPLKVKGKGKQLVAISEDQTVVEQLLLQGQSRYDFRDGVIERLGYHTRVWSKLSPQETAALTMSLGAYDTPVSNSCVLELPYGEPSASRLLNVEKLTALMLPVIAHMEPDWGRGGPSKLLIHPAIEEVGAERVGWLTYLAAEPSQIPPLPSPARVQALGKGSLIVATEERFTISNPDHINLVIQIHHALKEAGLPINA